MKKYILLIAILFASCTAPNQEPKTAGYFIQVRGMIGSDETICNNERDFIYGKT